MHQPYYKNLATGEAVLPWARMHGVKDYLDMALLLDDFPKMRQTFNVVPSLLEQLDEYAKGELTDSFFKVSCKKTADLTAKDKKFIKKNFFSADYRRMILPHARYDELYKKNEKHSEFTAQDYLDLVIWFNLVWLDPRFREEMPELRRIIEKGRGFSESDKQIVLDSQLDIIKRILPAYKRLQDEGKMEISVTPYFHPILPLLFSSFSAQDADKDTPLPKIIFSHPEDARWHVKAAMDYYCEKFGKNACGMWPSEQAVSREILPMLSSCGINWIVTDEGMLWKTVKRVRRSGRLLYRPYLLKAGSSTLTVVFRDRNLSDLIGFQYQHWKPKDAVDNFLGHLEKIDDYMKSDNALVTIALDGENAWEYYDNDGADFLKELYSKISDSKFIRSTTINDYLKRYPVKHSLPTIATGSWINGDLRKWMGHTSKNLAWEMITEARSLIKGSCIDDEKIMKQMYALEGSDWFWWYSDKSPSFDKLFRLHLKNLYSFLKVKPARNLNIPLEE